MSSPEFPIIEMGPWLKTTAGAYAEAWLQAQMDRAVADAFGYHAVQLGLPQLDGLRANRMPHRWLVDDSAPAFDWATGLGTREGFGDDGVLALQGRAAATYADFHALPFPTASIDLVVLPHTLEMSSDPHAALAEVARVLMPEGRVVIVGFNPMSLWGLRQWAGMSARLGRRALSESDGPEQAAEFLAYRRVRDWLRLLSFDIEAGRFGIWRPPVNTAKTLERLAWMDRVGSHWWPMLGGMYVLEAVKRVRGMSLVGMKPKPARRVVPSPAVTAPSANRQHKKSLTETSL